MPDSLVRTLNDVLTRALGVDGRFVLNDQAVPIRSPASSLAAELKRVANEIKAEAYDPASNSLDYARVRQSECYANLQRCAAQLNLYDPIDLQSDAERLAFWIDLYNVLVVHAVIAFGIKRTVWDDKGFFRRATYRIGGMRCSADDIEHGILRGNRRPSYIPFPVFAKSDPRRQWSVRHLDPRIHAALNCASRSCPPIGVYDPEAIDRQLDLAARGFVNATTRVVRSRAGPVLIQLSPVFKWYAADFGGRAGILQFVMAYLANGALSGIVAARKRLKLEWTHYDWSLNT